MDAILATVAHGGQAIVGPWPTSSVDTPRGGGCSDLETMLLEGLFVCCVFC